MKSKFEIRLITEDDTAAVLDIYRPFVQHTIVSFEYGVPNYQEFQTRIQSTIYDYPWLVCLFESEIVGYAHATQHRSRTAYQWSAECSVYIKDEFQGMGIGRLLYETLFSILRLQGYFNVVACIGLPNETSVAFHKALGFETIGIFKKVGCKLGNWHDTFCCQLSLSEHINYPAPPHKMEEVVMSETLLRILTVASEKANLVQSDVANHL